MVHEGLPAVLKVLVVHDGHLGPSFPHCAQTLLIIIAPIDAGGKDVQVHMEVLTQEIGYILGTGSTGAPGDETVDHVAQLGIQFPRKDPLQEQELCMAAWFGCAMLAVQETSFLAQRDPGVTDWSCHLVAQAGLARPKVIIEVLQEGVFIQTVSDFLKLCDQEIIIPIQVPPRFKGLILFVHKVVPAVFKVLQGHDVHPGPLATQPAKPLPGSRVPEVGEAGGEDAQCHVPVLLQELSHPLCTAGAGAPGYEPGDTLLLMRGQHLIWF